MFTTMTQAEGYMAFPLCYVSGT